MKRIKILTPSLFVVAILLFSGCDKLKDALEINFTTDEIDVTFTVNPTPAGEYSSTEEVVQSDLEQQITDNGGDVDKIKSIKIESCVLEVVTPDRTFNEFQSAELHLDQTKVAWIDNIPENSTSEILNFSQDNLDSFLQNETYTAVAKGTLDQELTNAITIKAKIKYSVKVSAI
jgi:hypothetical protein